MIRKWYRRLRKWADVELEKELRKIGDNKLEKYLKRRRTND